MLFSWRHSEFKSKDYYAQKTFVNLQSGWLHDMDVIKVEPDTERNSLRLMNELTKNEQPTPGIFFFIKCEDEVRYFVSWLSLWRHVISELLTESVWYIIIDCHKCNFYMIKSLECNLYPPPYIFGQFLALQYAFLVRVGIFRLGGPKPRFALYRWQLCVWVVFHRVWVIFTWRIVPVSSVTYFN